MREGPPENKEPVKLLGPNAHILNQLLGTFQVLWKHSQFLRGRVAKQFPVLKLLLNISLEYCKSIISKHRAVYSAIIYLMYLCCLKLVNVLVFQGLLAQASYLTGSQQLIIGVLLMH